MSDSNDVYYLKKALTEKTAAQINKPYQASQVWEGGSGGCDATARALTVHDVIDQRLSDLRLELNQLDALRRQLPQEMNLPAQEALINLIRRQSR